MVDRILGGNGQVSSVQRSRAFNSAGLPEQLQSLVDRVATRSSQVTDGDVAAVGTAGLSGDQIRSFTQDSKAGWPVRTETLPCSHTAIGTHDTTGHCHIRRYLVLQRTMGREEQP